MSNYEVVVAGYPPDVIARQDFDELVRRITAKEIRSEGAILVEKRADGEVVVTQTGDHLGRTMLIVSPPLVSTREELDDLIERVSLVLSRVDAFVSPAGARTARPDAIGAAS